MSTILTSAPVSFVPLVFVDSMSLDAILKTAVKERLKTVTRYQIAKDSGVGWNSLDRWLNGEGGLSLDSADKLCAYLDLRLCANAKCKDK